MEKLLQTQTLPIAFTNTSYQVSRCINNTTAGNSSIHDNGFGTLSKTTTSYKYRYPNVHTGWSHQWIAIGIQQWGRFSVGSSAKQITLPIAFPSAILSASRWQSNKSEDTNIRVNESTTTYIVAYNHGGTPTAQGYIVLGY